MSSRKLTIYSRSGHIVEQLTTNQVLLPKSAELSSITILDSNGAIVPFSYILPPTINTSINDLIRGEHVDGAVVKGEDVLHGKIISLEPTHVTILIDNKIHTVREYDQVVVPTASELFTRPLLILENEGKPVTLSYLLKNIAWTCVGTALINTTQNTMYLRLTGNIANDTESQIYADVTLVSGNVYQHRRSQGAGIMPQTPRALMAAPIEHEKVSAEALEDYVRYDVGTQILTKQNIVELGVWEFPVTKVYIHETRSHDTVQFGYRFTTSEFIPECSVNVYSTNANHSIDAYLGTSQIEETQKQTEIDLILGESTKLQCRSIIEPVSDQIITEENLAMVGVTLTDQDRQILIKPPDDRRLHRITERLEVQITNHNTTKSDLIVKHYIGSDRKLLQTQCKPTDKREGNTLIWYFDIPPGTATEPRKDQFECLITTLGYY